MKKKPNFPPIYRSVSMLILVVGSATLAYLIYYVLIFNDHCTGKIYGESIFKGGRYEVRSVKYYYTYNNTTFFDTKDEVVINEYEIHDSIRVSVLKFYPGKHRIVEVYRDLSKPSVYDPEEAFETQYHMHINTFEDYYGPSTVKYTSPDSNVLFYSSNKVTPDQEKIGSIIDRIRFNQGSLIESYLIRHNQDSIIVREIFYYLNNFSLDAQPPVVLREELSNAFPDKKIMISVLDKANPKHERILR